MTTFAELQMVVRTYMRAGRCFDYVEREVIGGADIPEDQKAALWLLAWSYLPLSSQRDAAKAHLQAVVEGVGD